MNTQNKTIKEILSLYDVILENKNLNEASDVYDNVDFNDTAVRYSKPSRDNINLALLQDIETAAKKAGVKVDITTAITGHKSGPNTRHDEGNAVDIAVINGKPVSLSNRADADKLVTALVSMGYVKNKEDGSTPKSILTFGVKNHDNHVHVSNTTQSPSDKTTTTDNPLINVPNSERSFLSSVGDLLATRFGLKENIDRIKNLL